QNNVAQVPVYRDALVSVPEHAANLSSKGTNFQQTTGLYLQDMIELNEHWKALVGVRYDIFGQAYDDDRVQNVDLDRT
ncbi:TonB-dependent receptor domain-containing protein, partial [Pseudomonas sp. SIMBA_067]